jgi:hypothetical protein
LEPSPAWTMSSITSVAGPSQVRSCGPQAFHAEAAVSHWSRVVDLYLAASN